MEKGRKQREERLSKTTGRRESPWDVWRRQAIQFRRAAEEVALPRWDSEERLSSPWVRYRKKEDAYNVYIEVWDRDNAIGRSLGSHDLCPGYPRSINATFWRTTFI